MSAPFKFAHISDSHIRPEAIERNQVFLDNLVEAQARGCEFILHTGDLMDEPSAWMARAWKVITSQVQVPIYVVPGNHDVYNPHLGDLKAPWWAKLAVDSGLEARYRGWFGPTWYTFAWQGAHFVALDSLIINSGLPEEAAQWAWLEEMLPDLAARQSQGLFVFTHLPLFIRRPDERLDAADFRNRYLLVAPPGRDRLLDLFRRYRVAAVFSGHLHVPWEVAHTWPEEFTTRFISTGSSGVPSAMAVEHFGLPLDPAQGLGYHEHRLAEEGLSSRYQPHSSALPAGRWRLGRLWTACLPPGQEPRAQGETPWHAAGYGPPGAEWRVTDGRSPLSLLCPEGRSFYGRQVFAVEGEPASLYLELCTARAAEVYLNGQLLYSLEPLTPRPPAWQSAEGTCTTCTIDSPALSLGLNHRLLRRGQNVLALRLYGSGPAEGEYIAFRERKAAWSVG